MINFITRIVVSIVSLGMLYSCNPIPDKSISDPLTPEELAKIFEKDTSFKATYEFVEIANKLVLNTDVKKAEYLSLTYRQFHDFFLVANTSSDAYKKLDSSYNEAWNKEIIGFQPEIDSISNYWKDYYSDKNINEYAYVDFAGEVKYTRYGFTDSFGLKFLIGPYKDYTMEKIKISYNIQDQIFAKDFENDRALDISQVISIHKFEIKRPIKGLEEVEIRIKRQNSDIFYELYPDGLDYDKQVFASVDEVVVNGKIIKNQANEIPYEVKKYWRETFNDSTNRFDQFTVTTFINEFLDEDFEFQFEFTKRKIKEYLENKDPLSAKYFFQFAEILSKFKD
ncbi:hypothetical protein [Algoriphagus persicinus]|uniref:hypothetical protein n=1 Tax=Algoriphagus persicinus TaxID=3108754 RepID=UPI002B3D2682|nr:hypothetical protein [Algoriphagus sp. E1-3-M2]MEB2784879.1 hypothetical protein [Algoriphagus sp. E1-3-M2]